MFGLVFTRRTWYLMLVISAALSMSTGFAAMVGMDLRQMGVAGFGVMGLAVLFLAAEKDNAPKIRLNYFQSFLLGMLGYALGGVLGLIGAALAWPMLFYTETKRGAQLSLQLQLLIVAEAMYAILWLLASFGISQLYFFVNVLAVLKYIAAGWGALILSKK